MQHLCMDSQATNVINNTFVAMDMTLVGHFKKITSHSASFHKKIVENHVDDMQSSSISEPDINKQLEQA